MIAEFIGKLWIMGIQSCALILVILIVRPFLKRHPKFYCYSLWTLVGISLLCPIRPASPYSLQPDFLNHIISSDQAAGKTFFQQKDSAAANEFTLVSRLLLKSTGFFKTDSPSTKFTDAETGADLDTSKVKFPDAFNDENHLQALTTSPNITDKNARNHIFQLIGIFYLAGVGIISLYFLSQYFKVRCKIRSAVRENSNVWLCDAISSPFVIGIFKPRILLPFTLKEPEKSHILLHERTHLRHHDPLAHLIGLICLCLHWWNPLVWLAIHCMQQDMEMFCDESVLKHANLEKRKAYAQTLLLCAEKQSGLITGLAFGESNTERRVENIMKKRKNNWFVMCCVILVAILCIVTFLTVPKAAKNKLEHSEAPVHFGNFALSDSTVYWSNLENEFPKVLPLPVESNYCAVYDNELYYTIERVGMETGEISDGHLTFYCCDLDGTNQRKLMELPEIYMVIDTVLQDGFLYCSYIKQEDAKTTTIAKIQTQGETPTEYQLSGLTRNFCFSKDCIYYAQYEDSSLWIFYAYYPESEEIKELYRYHGYYLEDFSILDNKLLLLLEMDGKLNLFSVDQNQTVTEYGNYEANSGRLLTGKEAYCSIDHILYRLDEKGENWIPMENLIPEGIEATDIFPFEEKNNSLYYLISGAGFEDEWKNTLLMRYDTVSGECEMLHAYYRP